MEKKRLKIEVGDGLRNKKIDLKKCFFLDFVPSRPHQ